VEKYIPEFSGLKFKDGTGAKVTIKHLLTHSAGLSELGYQDVEGMSKLAVAIPLVAKKPVQFVPGSQWKYCQSGINTAARVVEVISGKDFDIYLEETFFQPLGMKDTTFYPTVEQAERIVSAYKFNKGQAPEKVQISLLVGKSPTSRDRLPMANGGLFSTAHDYLRFAQMLLNDGELDGRRYLSSEAVKTFRTVQIPELVTGFTPGNGWGVGCCVVREPQGVSKSLSAGSYGHGGAYGTQVWIDPVKERIFILMVQRANFSNSDNSDVRAAFQDVAVQELEKI
jgi:CubicO group peptidase (beta-lactamase class C family)